jgi:hypothetical protein
MEEVYGLGKRKGNKKHFGKKNFAQKLGVIIVSPN